MSRTRQTVARLDIEPELIVVDRDYEPWLAAHDADDPGGTRRSPGDVVLQLYTSGTTGVPKGVLTTHRNLAAAAETSPLLGVRRRHRQPRRRCRCSTSAASAGRSSASGTVRRRCSSASSCPRTVLDALERRARDERDLRADDAADAHGVPGAAERDYSALRSIAYGASPITTPVLKAALRTFRLLALRGLRADRDDGRRRAARSGRPRPGRSPRAPAPLRRPAVPVGRAADRRPGDGRRAARRRGRRGVAARAERHARLLQPAARRPRRR